MAVPVEGEEPLYRIPGWELLDQQCREIWGCSLATVLGWGNVGMAAIYTPPPIPSSGVVEFAPVVWGAHIATALLLLVYGAAY